MDVSQLLKDVIEKDTQFKSTQVTKPIDLDLDLGTLLAIDTNPINNKLLTRKSSEYLYDLNRDNVQILLNNIWELPTERVEDAIVATLPPPTTQVPREKPLPKAKKETRWEAYAKLKGIQNKKKERMVWDQTYQEYRPAWGYNRANDETKQWLIEVPDNADPYEDQYEKRKVAKKERVAKNEFQRLKNIARNSKIPNSSLQPTEKPNKEQLNQALAIAKASTASAGKFAKALPKENEVKKPRGKKRQFESNTGSMMDEKERQMKVLNSLTNKKPRLNTDIAVKQNRREEEQARRAERSGADNNKIASKRLAKKQAAILAGKKKKNIPSGKKRRGKR